MKQHTFTLLFATLAFAAAMTPSWSQNAAAPPPFKKTVPTEQLSAAFRESGADAMITAIEAEPDRFPPLARLIANVNPNGPADQFGINTGCLIVRVDDTPLEPMGSLLRKNNPYTVPAELHWIDNAGELQRSKMIAEKLGIQSFQYRNLVSWYLQHGQRNPKWDRVVVAAILEQAENIDHAESMWAHACELGYKPDQLSSFFAMYRAFANGDATNAVAHAKHMRGLQAETLFPLNDEEWQNLFAFTGDPSWLQPILDRIATGDSELATMVPFHKYHKNLHEAAKATEPPSVLAANMKRRSFLRSGVTEKTWGESRGFFPSILTSAAAAADASQETFDAVNLSQIIDHFRNGWLAPGGNAKNLDVSIRFRVSPMPLKEGESCDYERVLTFGLANGTHTGDSRYVIPVSARILAMSVYFGRTNDGMNRHWRAMVPSDGVDINPFCRAGVYAQSNPPQTEVLPPFDADDGFHTLRVVRVNNQAEALLDGKRLALTNLPDGLDAPGVYLHFVGIKAEVIGFTADILE